MSLETGTPPDWCPLDQAPQATPEELLGAIAAVKPDHKDDVVVTVDIDRTIWDAIQRFKGRGR